MKRVNRATAFQGVCGCVLLSLLALSIASSSGSVGSVLFGSGCFGAGRLAIRKSRKCFVAARALPRERSLIYKATKMMRRLNTGLRRGLLQGPARRE